ncbi:iron ABC transporter permease [Nitratireductor aquimarinus]|nr:iron ABC transporter permease [Nitratireductor aquimarinus]MCA1301205.1 iron ABC transporter permease [Nitratireductor aquimarinus]
MLKGSQRRRSTKPGFPTGWSLAGPHLARMMIGGDHRLLLLFAAICGAALLLAADTIGRLAFSPTVLPVGIVVAFVGVPVFLHLIVSRRREAFA